MALPVILIAGGVLAGAHAANKMALQSSKAQQPHDAVRPKPVPRDIREVVQTPEFLRGQLKHTRTDLWAGGNYIHTYKDPVNKQTIYAVSQREDPYFGHGEGYL